MEITRETNGNQRWFADGKIVNRYLLFVWVMRHKKEIKRSRDIDAEMVEEYITWAKSQGWKWEA
jgi:hypothetical protein